LTVVIDAATVVAPLADDGSEGRWAEGMLAAWPIELFPYTPFAVRVWELRGAITADDA
jgi:hypothetical protein